MTNAKEFLLSQGINLDTTSLFSVIDGKARQPDLIFLMEQYANLRIEEHKTEKSIPKLDIDLLN